MPGDLKMLPDKQHLNCSLTVNNRDMWVNHHCKEVEIMAARTANTFWNILYAILVVLVILALLQLLGVIALSAGLASFIYVVTIVLLVLAVVHWAGLF